MRPAFALPLGEFQNNPAAIWRQKQLVRPDHSAAGVVSRVAGARTCQLERQLFRDVIRSLPMTTFPTLFEPILAAEVKIGKSYVTSWRRDLRASSIRALARVRARASVTPKHGRLARTFLLTRALHKHWGRPSGAHASPRLRARKLLCQCASERASKQVTGCANFLPSESKLFIFLFLSHSHSSSQGCLPVELPGANGKLEDNRFLFMPTRGPTGMLVCWVVQILSVSLARLRLVIGGRRQSSPLGIVSIVCLCFLCAKKKTIRAPGGGIKSRARDID